MCLRTHGGGLGTGDLLHWCRHAELWLVWLRMYDGID